MDTALADKMCALQVDSFYVAGIRALVQFSNVDGCNIKTIENQHFSVETPYTYTVRYLLETFPRESSTAPCPSALPLRDW